MKKVIVISTSLRAGFIRCDHYDSVEGWVYFSK